LISVQLLFLISSVRLGLQEAGKRSDSEL